MQDKFILIIFIAFLATYSSRLLPFLLFNKKSESKKLLFIQHNMPLAIMVILVFYTFYSYDLSSFENIFSLFLSCVFVLFLHIVFKSALFSIVFGILFYMLCLRII